MACFSPYLVLLLLPLVLPTLQVHSQSHIQQALPNLAKILNESGHTKFMSLLCSTGTGCYIERQLNHTGGITLFSPTDDAFFDLNLSREQLVRLAKYHFVPEYLTMAMLDINGGFVGTMATDYIGKPYHLDFYSFGERLHAVTGIVDAQVSIMYQEFPLAIYQVDKLLLPPEIFKSLHPPEESPGPTSLQNGDWFEYSAVVPPLSSDYFNADLPTTIPPADMQYPASSFVPVPAEDVWSYIPTSFCTCNRYEVIESDFTNHIEADATVVDAEDRDQEEKVMMGSNNFLWEMPKLLYNFIRKATTV